MEGKEKGDMKKVLVVGSLNMDMVLSVDHHPVPGETIIGDGITYHPGGKVANQAYAVGKLGGDVRIIGCVGWDNNGMILTENLAQAGVDTTAINRMPEAPTGMAIIDVDKKGDNSIIVISGANACLTPDLLRKQKASVEWSDFIMTQLETPIDTVLELARMAKKADKCMILDPSPARADLPDELFPLIDIMKPNEKELSILTGMPTETDEEIKAERAKIVEAVTERFGEVEVIDSFFESAPHDAKPLWFLGKSLELLSTADCAYFAEGWKDYRGCKIEHECAVQYGIDIVGE